jgi:predicted nucleic acid-binding protein
MALILDTGPLVALLDATDPDHERCAELIRASNEQRVVPVCVLVEVEYMLRPWPKAFAALLAEFGAGSLELLELPKHWLPRVGELLDRYRDLSFGLVDATVLAATEMLEETKLATLDQRHFHTIKPAHCEALQLLPE